ncbi:MAG: type II toxin-antitoxin system RelE/ParE family toxin [Oculatellaceae cyanobacterium Prado106]|jgi:toxin ParE1/3/4|nr:type II toxin-antitoxin system RelE/ParE family toxin [Oculatellaceae cyanobacterium Prado106]
MSQYIISDEAIQDLNQISNYFFQTNVEAGEQFLLAFNAKCQQLVNFPKIGRSYAHLRPNLRGLTLKGFIILYQVSEMSNGNKLEILRVVSGRRDLNNIFSD